MADQNDNNENVQTYRDLDEQVTRAYDIHRESTAETAEHVMGDRRFDTNRRDEDGRMVIYYSFGDEGLGDGTKARMEEAYGDGKYPFQFDELSFDDRMAFHSAANDYQDFIPVRFVPLSEAPAGTEPDLVVGRFEAEAREQSGKTYYTRGAFQDSTGVPPVIGLNTLLGGRSRWERTQTMLHEIGHVFGLVHPNGGEAHQEGDIQLDDTLMSSNRPDVGFGHARADVWLSLAPAEIAALQSVYGAVEHSGDARRITPLSAYSSTREAFNGGITIPNHADGMRLSVADYFREQPSVQGFSATLSADLGGRLRRPSGYEHIEIAPGRPLREIVASQHADFLTASREEATTLRGGDGVDTYAIPEVSSARITRSGNQFTVAQYGLAETFIEEGGETYSVSTEAHPESEHYGGSSVHTIIDSAENVVHMAEGANLVIQYEGEGPHETEIHVDFRVASITPVLRDEHYVKLLMTSQDSDVITMLILPTSDQQVIENRLRVQGADGVYSSDVSVAQELPEQSNEIIVTASRETGGRSR